jgi:hypothetical protein
MLSKRIVAIAADKAFAKKLAAGLQAAGGTVEAVATIDDLARGEIHADLVVAHIPPGDGTLVATITSRLRKEAGFVAVIDHSSIEQIVEVMKAGRVASVLVADDLTTATLSATATRLLYGDVFGLEKAMPWGVKIYSTLVGDYQEKSVVISAVSDFATAVGVRRKYRESIEQVLDELLMNALYDAPVDAAGKQMFADVPTKTRISLRMEQKAVVQYACEGNMFALSVRDSFGALKGDTIVKYLDKCLHAEQQIDRKAGGAGLGLYIISNAATQFVVNIFPGVATEVMCTFDLTAAKVQLKHFGIFYERIDSSGRLVAGPSRLLGAGRAATVGDPTLPVQGTSRAVTVALSAAIVLLLALIGIVAYPRFVEATGAIAITSDPPGASIEVDGRAVGSTQGAPLEVDDLSLGKNYKVTARLDGYEPAELIAAPGKQPAPVTVKLVPKQSVVTVDSDPQAATVLVDGQERGPTPMAITDLPAGSEHELTLRRTGYSDIVRKVKIPPPGREQSVNWSLTMSPDFAAVRLESEPPGARVLQNGELLAGVVTPVTEHLVQAGKPYTFTLKLDGFQPLSQTVTLEPGARGQRIGGKLNPGASLSVSASLPEVHISVVGVAACTDKPTPLVDCPVGKGKQKVKLTARNPPLDETIEVEVKDRDVSREIGIGFVETDGELMLLQGHKNVRKLATLEGRQQVVLVDPRTGESSKKSVVVPAGGTVKIGAK